MMQHPEIAFNKMCGPQAKDKMKESWQTVAEVLNCEVGPAREASKWQKAWNDWKHNTKTKASKIRNAMQVTGGGTIDIATSLTQLEEKLLCFIGHSIIDGDGETSEPTITDHPQTISTSPVTVTVIEKAETTSDQEKVDDGPPKKKQKKDLHDLVQQQTSTLENMNNNISTLVDTLKEQNKLLARIATALGCRA